MKKLVSLLMVAVMMFAVMATASAELLGPGNVTLKRLSNNSNFDVNEDYMVPIIEQSTGYKVEYFALPAQDAETKLMMDIRTQDYDIVTVNVDTWRTLVANNALQPLDDLLAQYGPDILAGNSEEVWKALTGSDGHIYGMPYMYPHSHEIATFMAARWDLMKAAGIEKVPETLDEFYDCLVTLKKFYGDEYIILTGPFRAASEGNENWVIPKTIACAFGIYNDWMVDENGKVIYMTEAPGFADMVAFLTKLHDEGLIDEDWAVNTTPVLNEKFASGKAIISCSNRAGVTVTTPAQLKDLGLTYDDLCYISALKGPDGTCTYMETEAINQISCIPVRAKHPEDAINWINLKVQDQLFINIGVEGVHFTYDEQGQISPINPIFANERGDSFYYIDCTNAYDYQFQWPSRIRKSDAQWAAFSVITMNADPSIFVTNEFKFMPASEAFAKYNTALFKSTNDFITQILSGSRTIDNLDAFTKDWVSNGGEEVRAELQAYYDSQK